MTDCIRSDVVRVRIQLYMRLLCIDISV